MSRAFSTIFCEPKKRTKGIFISLAFNPNSMDGMELGKQLPAKMRSAFAVFKKFIASFGLLKVVTLIFLFQVIFLGHLASLCRFPLLKFFYFPLLSPFKGTFSYLKIAPLRVAVNSEIFTLSCLPVSRSRMVTVPLSKVSKSMVTQNGVPISSCRR